MNMFSIAGMLAQNSVTLKLDQKINGSTAVLTIRTTAFSGVSVVGLEITANPRNDSTAPFDVQFESSILGTTPIVQRSDNAMRVFFFANPGAPMSSPEGVLGFLTVRANTDMSNWLYTFSNWKYVMLDQNLKVYPTELEPLKKGSKKRGADFFNYSVFPNPFSEAFMFHLDGDDVGECSVGLYDILGRKLWKSTFFRVLDNPIRQRIDASGLAQGVYILRIEAKDLLGYRVATNRKIVKLR